MTIISLYFEFYILRSMTVQPCGDVDIDANTNYVEEVWGNIHHHEPLHNVREIPVRSVYGRG